ncbi:hypothetical protein [Bradyrhizobium sp. STM 3809]|uniref:hypothetical protein n=1 Tax=Bradyrhizobium sp. STM 3809 TaxID=551936 RepID=UPI001F0B6CDE|nr:hypothetical protein [Bradyrhizobium sp. STM 3809]
MLALCLATTPTQAAGLRTIDIPADADGPAIRAMVWYPCAEEPVDISGVLPSQVAFVGAHLAAQHDYRVVPNSGHFAVVLCPPALIGAQSDRCADAPGFDRAAFQAEFNKVVIAFFGGWLMEPAK